MPGSYAISQIEIKRHVGPDSVKTIFYIKDREYKTTEGSSELISNIKMIKELHKLSESINSEIESLRKCNSYLIETDTSITKKFISYYKVQVTGKYNMITEADKVKKITGLSDDDYEFIVTNYKELYLLTKKFTDEIDKSYLEYLNENLSK